MERSTLPFRRSPRRLLSLALLTAGPLLAQQPTPPADPLLPLVREGLARNPGLRAAELAVRRDAAGVDEARGRFLPSLGATYRRSELSGAVVNLGQLINPAFGALNQLTGTQQFPTNINLRLPIPQEATMRLAQPLFEPRVLHGYRIAQAVRAASDADLATQRRQLTADIQLAYLQFARASRALEIYEGTVPLLDEALRVSERLLAAGTVTPDNVLRARAERSAVVQQRDAARQSVHAALQQFNLLVGRALDAPLPLIADSSLTFAARFSRDTLLESAERQALTRREELTQLDEAGRVASGQRRLAQAGFLPSVNLAVDYGFQGNTLRIGRNTDFAVASLVVSWNLFNGGQDAARIQQARAIAAQTTARREDVARRIALQVRVAHEAATVARAGIATAVDRLTAADRTFQLVQRRFAQGLASQLELLDARTALTTAQFNRLLTEYDFHARVVEYERAAATFPLE
jgi:outer membrane protein TolC